MLRKIEALRKQPKSVRNRYAFTIALSSTLIILLLWSLSLPSRLKVESTVVEQDNDGPSLTEQLSGLRNLVDEGLEDIQAQAQLLEATSTTTGTSSVAIESESTSTSPVVPTPNTVLIGTTSVSAE